MRSLSSGSFAQHEWIELAQIARKGSIAVLAIARFKPVGSLLVTAASVEVLRAGSLELGSKWGSIGAPARQIWRRNTALAKIQMRRRAYAVAGKCHEMLL